MADGTPGRFAAVAGDSADAGAVPVLPPPAAAVVVAAGRRPRPNRPGRSHGTWRYRPSWPFGGAGLSRHLRRRHSAPPPALLARGHLRTLPRRPEARRVGKKG